MQVAASSMSNEDLDGNIRHLVEKHLAVRGLETAPKRPGPPKRFAQICT